MLRSTFLLVLVMFVPIANGQETSGRHVALACNLMRGVAYSPGQALQVAAANRVVRENYHQQFLLALPWNAFTRNVAVGFPDYQERYAIRDGEQGDVPQGIAVAIRRELSALKFPEDQIGEFNDLAVRLRELAPQDLDEQYLPEKFHGPRLYSLLILEAVLASVSGTADDDERSLAGDLPERFLDLPAQVEKAQLLAAVPRGSYSLVQFQSLPPGSRVQALRHGFLSSWFGYSDIPGYTQTYRWMGVGTYDFQCTKFADITGRQDGIVLKDIFETVDFGRVKF